MTTICSALRVGGKEPWRTIRPPPTQAVTIPLRCEPLARAYAEQQILRCAQDDNMRCAQDDNAFCRGSVQIIRPADK
jgi:hypothetical protein